LWLTGQRERVRPVLAAPRTAVIAGIGSFITYTLVLAATRLAPVAYVGPMREVSIVFGIFIGARFLGERLTSGRVIGVILVVIGIVAIKLFG
jgi:drug/metabolite transporter (DMT)-like permease